jgi:anti-anti-sigma factor
MNATTLGVIISAHSNFVRRGDKMVLASVDRRIENIFVITKLHLIFDIYPTVDQAVAALVSLSAELM